MLLKSPDYSSQCCQGLDLTCNVRGRRDGKRLRTLVIPWRKLPVAFLTKQSLGRMNILVKAAFSCVSVSLFLSLNQEIEFGQE